MKDRAKKCIARLIMGVFKILNKKDEKVDILERISRTKIVISGDIYRGKKGIILLRELENGLKILPSTVIDLVNSHPAGPFNIFFVSGSNPPKELAIYLSETNQCQFNKKRLDLRDSFIFLRTMIIHEIGHAYDYVIGELSSSLEWKNIMEKEQPPTKYAKKNEHEDFAESFTLYFAAPEYLTIICPLRYKKLEEILQQVNTKGRPETVKNPHEMSKNLRFCSRYVADIDRLLIWAYNEMFTENKGSS